MLRKAIAAAALGLGTALIILVAAAGGAFETWELKSYDWRTNGCDLSARHSPEEADHQPKQPAIAVAPAWVAAATAVVAAAVAVEAVAAAVVVAAAVAVEGAGAKRDEQKNIKTKNYELTKTSVPGVGSDTFEFHLRRSNGRAGAKIGCCGWSAA